MRLGWFIIGVIAAIVIFLYFGNAFHFLTNIVQSIINGFGSLAKYLNHNMTANIIGGK